MEIREYIENVLLNKDTRIKWSADDRKIFIEGRVCCSVLYKYLERRFFTKAECLVCRLGDLKSAITFTIFSEALSCYISALHLGWNGHTTAANMLVRRIYELLVDLSFMLHKDSNRRLRRFTLFSYVSSYIRLCNMYPELSKRDLFKELRNNLGRSFDERRRMFLKHKRKFGIRERTEQHKGRIHNVYIIPGDWAYGLVKKDQRTSIFKRANSVGLGDLHYKLGYSLFSSKTHPDALHIGLKLKIADSYLEKVKYQILPKDDKSMRSVIISGTQYVMALFIMLAKVFNFYTLPNNKNDKDLLSHTEKLKKNEDFKEYFKKVKIKSESDF